MSSKIIKLKDNSQETLSELKYIDKEKISKEDLTNIKEIASKTLYGIKDNILIFPNSLKESKDLNEKLRIFDFLNGKIYTNNLMGFIGYKNTQIKITSRFTNEKEDYFLHYMLMKVLSLNIINLEHSKDYDDSFDFLIYMFISFFKRALRQGIFKEYKLIKHNDSNVKGIIDVKRYIKNNIPFNGKISYNTREYSYDNNITQLIRHTIEYIKTKNRYILNLDNEVKDYTRQIFYSTPSYDKNKRNIIINKNKKKLSHPYYYEYEPLRKICIQILRYEKLKYGRDDNTVYGLLFDGAWLFEEYLNTFLSKKGFIHSENRNSKNSIKLLDNGWRVYPDFYKIDNKNNIVLDAKYKKLNYYNNESIDRNDKHQIVSYAYTLNAKKAGFIYPLEDVNKKTINNIGKLASLDCDVLIIPFIIPSTNFQTIKDFKEAIEKCEDELICNINLS